MEHRAAPGTITLTTAVLRLIESLVRVNAVGPLPVKGFTEPVEGFELLGASDLRRRLHAAALHGRPTFLVPVETVTCYFNAQHLDVSWI
jgi:hypothetical protein